MDQRGVRQTRESSNFANRIQEFIVDIADNEITDEKLIENLNSVPGDKSNFVDYKEGKEELNILHLATKLNRLKLIQHLVENLEISINSVSKHGMTALHLLVIATSEPKGNTGEDSDSAFNQILNYFMRKKIYINLQDDKGFTPLHYAIIYKNKDVAMALISADGINLNLEDKRSMTALQLSAKEDLDQVTSILIDKTDVSQLIKPSIANFPLHSLCKSQIEKLDIIEKILKKLKDASVKKNFLDMGMKAVDSKQASLMHIAVEFNHSNIVESLLTKYNGDCKVKDSNGDFLIHLVAKTGSTEMLEILTNNDGLISKENLNSENALHIAAFYNNKNFVTKYLELENDGKIIDYDTPSIQVLNKNGLTPIQVSIVANNSECFKVLMSDKNAKLNVKSITGNSAYHTCAKVGNVPSFTYLLQNFYSKNPNYLTSKNRKGNTVLHTAAKSGSLEIITLLYETLKNSSTFEQFLLKKNTNGETFFHLACLNGQLPVVNFFLTNLKMITLTEQVDNASNTPLHLSVQNGHTSIVNVLLGYTKNMKSKNYDNLTAFELSCRRGHSSISKSIILHAEINESEFPLHTACFEGAIDVVLMLLKQGINIALLNDDNKNCLDISIERKEENIIKLLLNDLNWESLFMKETTQKKKDSNKEFIVHNPQFAALYEAKMWNIFEIILDKCYNSEKSLVDFSFLDRRNKSNLHHPLMFIARSGDQNLIKHGATLLLLKLKWRYLPRLIYYCNLLLSSIFLILMCLFGLNHRLNTNECKKTSCVNTIYLSISIIVFNLLSLIKFVIEFLLTDRTAFILSFENWFELSCYISTMLAVTASDEHERRQYGSWAVLSSFITYPLYLQKMRILGVYVVAFVRTLKNSAKFLPVFFVILAGFILSMYMNYSYGLHLGNEVHNSLAFTFTKVLSMSIGDVAIAEDTSLYDFHNSMNYIILFLFMIMFNVVMFNLFVGIAVTDINSVLGESEVRLYSLRIAFSLQIQTIVESLCKKSKFFEKRLIKFIIFNDYDKDFQTSKRSLQPNERIQKLLDKTGDSIKLADPHKRLDDIVENLTKSADNDLDDIEKVVKSKVEQIEFKLNESTRNINGSLFEIGKKSEGGFTSLYNVIDKTNQSFTDKVNKIEGKLAKSDGNNFEKKKNEKKVDTKAVFIENMNNKFETVENKIDNINQKFGAEIIDLKSQMNQFIKSMNASLQRQTNEIQNSLFLSECSIRTDLTETSHFIGTKLISTRKLVTDISTGIDGRDMILPVIPGASQFE